MKVSVTAGASGLDAPMDPRFGRCPFFVIVDTESMSEISIANSNVNATSGAGIQAAQEIAAEEGGAQVGAGERPGDRIGHGLCSLDRLCVWPTPWPL